MINLVTYANSAADRWVSWIAGASLDSAPLLALVGLVWLAVRRRAAPQVGYCLFLLIPLKLLVPLVVTVPVALAHWTPSALASSWFEETQVAEQVDRRPPAARPIVETVSVPTTPSEPSFEPPGARAHRVPAPRPLAHSAPERPRLSRSAMLLIAWLSGVSLLLAQLVRSQLRFRARIKNASDLDASTLPIDLCELCRRAGVHPTIRILEDDSIPAPAVWAILRPTIILPRGLVLMLSAEQLRWVLLHELAHVGRRDLLVVMLQRLAAVLHFFNPAIWIANRIIHELREFACDDLALSLSRASAVESGEAFVRILAYAADSRRGLEGNLSIFGLDSRAACFLRVRRLLDTDRRIRHAPGAWSLWGLLVLAAISVPQLRAANDPEPNAGASAPAEGRQEFELHVVGPDGKPVPGAVVELRTNAPPTAEQVRRGTFVKKNRYGADVKTDAEGQLVVTIPRAPTNFAVDITIPGYGPYWAGWSSENHVEPIPLKFTAELDAAWSVGGIIVDAAGKPVEGVTVGPWIEFKKRPGDTQQFYAGAKVKTDAAGRWRYDSVPAKLSEVHVEISHPGFQPERRSLTRAEFGIEPGREPTGRVVIDRGLTVSGTVTDRAGKPIAGALVRTKFLNDIREATTGDDGVYRLAGCEPRTARIVVSARGRATDMKEVKIDPAMGPVDFQMSPGGTVRIRVLDEHGKPIPKARIFFQEWRGRFHYFEFNHVSQYADKDGLWVWNEAPLDEFQADICCNDEVGMDLVDQPLIARAEEYVFRLPGPLIISGKVVDAQTREPIKAFRVVPGVRSSATHMNWIRQEAFPVTDGRYELRRSRGDFGHLVRIEADGYKAGVSRDIKSTEGKVTIDFALTKGQNIVGRVMTRGVVPAVGAKIALGIGGSQISIKNGDIDDGSTYAARATTDDTGRFQFPAQSGDFQLIMTHPEGYAHIKSSPEWDVVKIIRLEPWARVEGTFRVGPTPVANVPITINVETLHSYGEDVPSIFTHHDVTSGPGGRFVFDRVVAGPGAIGRRIMLTVNDGATEATSSTMIRVNFVGGKTNTIDLGGTGRPVTGKLQPPAGFKDRVLWNFAEITAHPSAPEAQANGPYIFASVDRDGRFRIVDVPAGDYSLMVRFSKHEAGRLFNHRFKVPPVDGKPAAEPVDLGTLTLEK